MSDYLETDFCDVDSGLDYIFGYMGAIYGASFNRHWEGMDAGLIRQVWKDQLGRFLTYKPSLDFAMKHLNGDFPPSAIKFRDYCNSGPDIPNKPMVQITRQKTQAEIEASEKAKQEALKKLAELRRSFGEQN
jgi:hypothetical protein